MPPSTTPYRFFLSPGCGPPLGFLPPLLLPGPLSPTRHLSLSIDRPAYSGPQTTPRPALGSLSHQNYASTSPMGTRRLLRMGRQTSPLACLLDGPRRCLGGTRDQRVAGTCPAGTRVGLRSGSRPLRSARLGHRAARCSLVSHHRPSRYRPCSMPAAYEPDRAAPFMAARWRNASCATATFVADPPQALSAAACSARP